MAPKKGKKKKDDDDWENDMDAVMMEGLEIDTKASAIPDDDEDGGGGGRSSKKVRQGRRELRMLQRRARVNIAWCDVP